MVQMPYLWTRSPKVDIHTYTDISSRLTSKWIIDDIWDEVEKSDITDEDDKLATTRALLILRNERRRILQNQ